LAVRPAFQVIAAIAAGAAVPLAFAPYGAYFLAPVCLALLFHLWETRSPRCAAATGYWFGLGMFGHGIWWIQVSVHQFGLPLYSFSVPVTGAFVLFMSVYPALAGYLYAYVRGESRALGVLLVAPAAWVTIEWLRGWLFTGFPWLLIGYSQSDSPLSTVTPVLGTYGVGLLTGVIAGGLVLLINGKHAERIAALGLIAMIGAGSFALEQIEWTEKTGDPLTVALVQGAVPQAVKWRRDFRQPSIDLYTELSAGHWGSSLIVWPETAIPAFPAEVPETLQNLRRRARDNDTTLLTGMPTADTHDGSRYLNSVVALGANDGVYHKRHLVPFGEYLPFDRWLRPVLTFLRIPMSNFASGAAAQPPVIVADHVVGISICYEDAYATEVVRALPQAAILINVSNDAWFGDSIAPHQHLQIARMRALEAGRVMLRATNTGISAIIDHRGRVVSRSGQFEPEVLGGEVSARTGTTPFTDQPRALLPLLCIASLIGVRLLGRKQL